MLDHIHRPKALTGPRVISWPLVAACLIGLVFSGCQNPPAAERSKTQEERGECALHSGRIEIDTTLYKACSPYILRRGGIDVVYDAVLTIEPGVEVRFADGDWLEISADYTEGASIIARGTPEEPIVLTSVTPDKLSNGTWLGLWLNKGTAHGVLSNVIIRAAGGDNRFIKPTLVHGCLTLTDIVRGDVTLDHVKLEHCLNAGMVLRRSELSLNAVEVNDAPIGVLLDGVPPASLGDSIVTEDVAQPIAEGPSTRGSARARN